MLSAAAMPSLLMVPVNQCTGLLNSNVTKRSIEGKQRPKTLEQTTAGSTYNESPILSTTVLFLRQKSQTTWYGWPFSHTVESRAFCGNAFGPAFSPQLKRNKGLTYHRTLTCCSFFLTSKSQHGQRETGQHLPLHMVTHPCFPAKSTSRLPAPY